VLPQGVPAPSIRGYTSGSPYMKSPHRLERIDAPMADATTDTNAGQAKREYTQLLRLHERLLNQFQRAREELSAPGTQGLVRDIKARTGTAPELAPIKTAVEEAIRALKLSESTIQGVVMESPDSEFEIDGVNNMPVYLQRFLAERASQPGFTFEVVNDDVRGWMICWKEYTHRGTVRGYGQFYERPYAWLED